VGLIDIDDARSRVLGRVGTTGTEDVPLRRAEGRRLAAAVRSRVAVPGFDNSAMDGWAVRASDVAAASVDEPAELALVGESRAGHPAGVAVGAGEAIAISTGAMLPEGADAVIRVEDSERRDASVTNRAAADPGKNVSRRG
jgi:molybdopterin biosynthesis enzyme